MTQDTDAGTGRPRAQRIRRALSWLLWGNVLLVVAAATLIGLILASGAGAEVGPEVVESAGSGSRGIGLIAAALSTGFAAVGAGYAVAHVGAASVGAMSERPELAGRVLIFVGLAEGIAIYGLIISVMILGRL